MSRYISTAPVRTVVTLPIGRGKISGVANTVMTSRFIENAMAEILELSGGCRELATEPYSRSSRLRRVLYWMCCSEAVHMLQRHGPPPLLLGCYMIIL